MGKPIHAMIRVVDEIRSVEFYRRAFGLQVRDRFPFDKFTLVYLGGPEDDFELELTINHGRTTPYPLGEGYGHIAFVVDDLDHEHARFVRDGLGPGAIKELHRDGALMAKFFFVTDPDGYHIEILQKHGRYR
jgi:lactoylglutathione lyase